MKVVSQQAGFNLWLFQNSSEERTPTGGHKEGECLSLENSTRATTRESIYKLFTKWKQEAKLKDIYTLLSGHCPLEHHHKTMNKIDQYLYLLRIYQLCTQNIMAR